MLRRNGRVAPESFQAIINDAPQAIIIADKSRNIFLVNPAVTRISSPARSLRPSSAIRKAVMAA